MPRTVRLLGRRSAAAVDERRGRGALACFEALLQEEVLVRLLYLGFHRLIPSLEDGDRELANPVILGLCPVDEEGSP